jgi:hypothetical protein
MTEIQSLREEIRQLHLRRARGDIRERTFQQAVGQRTMELYRARIKGRLGPGEPIVEEHHVIQAHMRLTESVLKEPEQGTVSLFLTDRRILRLRSTIAPDRPITCDHRDGTRIDEIPLDRIRDLKVHRQVRPGEAWVGLALATMALLFYSWLSITGPVLLALGVLGVLHGLLLPTRRIEIRTDSKEDPFFVHAPRKKSAKRLLAVLREQSCGLVPQPAGA